jgi:hypothetical protein
VNAAKHMGQQQQQHSAPGILNFFSMYMGDWNVVI